MYHIIYGQVGQHHYYTIEKGRVILYGPSFLQLSKFISGNLFVIQQLMLIYKYVLKFWEYS